MKAWTNYVIDSDRGIISPLAPGQRWTHRAMRDATGVIGRVETNGTQPELTVYMEECRILASQYTWDDIAHFYRTMRFVEWAHSDPFFSRFDLSRYPHQCPRCRSAAYVGAGGGAAVDCTNLECPTRKR